MATYDGIVRIKKGGEICQIIGGDIKEFTVVSDFWFTKITAYTDDKGRIVSANTYGNWGNAYFEKVV